jgi:PAS domain-containing protein
MTSIPPLQIRRLLTDSPRTRAIPFAQLLCPCWVHDSRTGGMLDANPAVLQLYGYERAD